MLMMVAMLVPMMVIILSVGSRIDIFDYYSLESS